MVTKEESTLLKGTNLHPADIVIIVLYFILVIGFGIWSSMRNRGSIGGYFLAGRNMHWIPVGASLFSSNIGSDHFIGLAGSGAASGIGTAAFELNALFVLMILGWLFAPVYIAAGIFTMPEYLMRRFGGNRIRIYLSCLALLLSVFTKIAPALYAGGTFLDQALHWNLYFSILILLAIAGLFTISGGLTAVIWTDFIQTIIMVLGAFVLMGLGFKEVGGFEMLKYKYMRAVPNTTLYSTRNDTCGYPPQNSLHLIRSASDPNFPWSGVIFGLTVSAVWYWCSDQVIVQRTLAAKNLSHAKAGCLVAGYLKILPLFILVMPGMMARVLFPDAVGCADPVECMKVCDQRTGCTNRAYPMLVVKLMPHGARGLMMAVMIAALMSSLTSIFNSSSTIFTMDIWRRIRKNAGDMELMIVGRVFVLVMVAISVVWIPIVKNFSELFSYIQSVTSYLAPPVCAVYVLAVFWPRANEKGAFCSLMIGLVVGLVRFIWEITYKKYPCVESHLDTMPHIIKKVHYLHFGILLFGLSVIVMVVVSLLTKKIDEKHLVRLTFWTRHSTEERIDIMAANDTTPNTVKEDSSTKPPKQCEDSTVHIDHSKMSRIPGTGLSVIPVQAEYSNVGFVPDSETTKNINEAENVKNIIVSQSGQGDKSKELGVYDNSENSKMAEPKLPFWRNAVNWICGIEKHDEIPVLSEEEQKEFDRKMTSLYEVPKWKYICNANAIILLSVAIFVWGFFH